MGEDQVSPLSVQAGLFVLQYIKSLSRGTPPVVEVRVPSETRRYVQIISSPFDAADTISAPGGCLVIRAEQASTVQVAVVSATGARAGEVELRLEALVTGQAASPQRGEPVSSPGPVGSAGPSGVELVGTAHVSRRGDVPVGGDKWVAGPSEPAPIEGLEIRLNAPGATLRLEYQVLVGGKDGGWTPWLRGEYAGTRGQYRPLLGIRFRLAGDAAQSLTLHVDALFLGSTVETARGNTLELISGAGVDPLVGLKIALVPTTKGKVQSENTAIRPPTAQPAETRASRVRVFRSSSLR